MEGTGRRSITLSTNKSGSITSQQNETDVIIFHLPESLKVHSREETQNKSLFRFPYHNNNKNNNNNNRNHGDDKDDVHSQVSREDMEHEEEQWSEYSLNHGGGMHKLRMKYASHRSMPCLIRINGEVMKPPVAFGTTHRIRPYDRSDDEDLGLRSAAADSPSSSSSLKDLEAIWSEDEGVFDLGKPGTVHVAFRPVVFCSYHDDDYDYDDDNNDSPGQRSMQWPRIEAFQFVKETTNAEQLMIKKRLLAIYKEQIMKNRFVKKALLGWSTTTTPGNDAAGGNGGDDDNNEPPPPQSGREDEEKIVINQSSTSIRSNFMSYVYRTLRFRQKQKSNRDDNCVFSTRSDDDELIFHNDRPLHPFGKRLKSQWQMYQKSPTSITYTFEIGQPFTDLPSSHPSLSSFQNHDYLGGVEFPTLYLYGAAIKFVFGDAHDSLTVNGNRLGDPYGGDNFPEVTFWGPRYTIRSITLGLSTYLHNAVFSGMILEKQKNPTRRTNNVLLASAADKKNRRDFPKFKGNTNMLQDQFNSWRECEDRPLVGCSFRDGSAYTFDSHSVGLQISITSIVAPKHRPISRYGFTLSSGRDMTFSYNEFSKFWDWFVHIKHTTLVKGRPYRYLKQKAGDDDNDDDNKLCLVDPNSATLNDVKSAMKPLELFLKKSFTASIKYNEGFLFGTARYSYLCFDVFSIYIHRIPAGHGGSDDIFRSVLFVDGKQYDNASLSPVNDNVADISLSRNDIIAFAISVALRDTELLSQMGLARPRRRLNRGDGEDYTSSSTNGKVVNLEEVMEPELLPLIKDDLFRGDYKPTVMARRAVTILALAGLRRVSYESILDDLGGWDIYDVAAGSKYIHSPLKHKFILLTSYICAFIQIIVPLLLVYRTITSETEVVTWDIYMTRFIFGLYSILIEFKSYEVDNSAKLTGLLCFIPEFSRKRLIFGLVINQISKIITSIAVIVLMGRTFDLVDITLNALALYFILDIDDYLVSENTVTRFKCLQEKEFFVLKSKTVVEFKLDWFQDHDLPKLKNIPANYFELATNRFSLASIVILVLGCIWLITEPLIFGWDATLYIHGLN